MKTKPFSKIYHTVAFVFLVLFLNVWFNQPLSAGTPSYFNATIKINPECKIKRMSNGTVLVYQKNGNTLELKQQITDFNADLLMALYRGQRMEYIITTFAKKYGMSDDDCRRQIKHALNVFADWDIITREDNLATR